MMRRHMRSGARVCIPIGISIETTLPKLVDILERSGLGVGIEDQRDPWNENLRYQHVLPRPEWPNWQWQL